MKSYQLGKLRFTKCNYGLWVDSVHIQLCTEQFLLDAGATLVEEEEDDGEREGSCVYCGFRREDRQPCRAHTNHRFSKEKRVVRQPKPEEKQIEMPDTIYVGFVNFDGDKKVILDPKFGRWMQQITDDVNALNQRGE